MILKKKLCGILKNEKEKDPGKDLEYCKQLFNEKNVPHVLQKINDFSMINIKEIVYRFPTLMIMSLGRQHGIYNKPSIEIFKMLCEEGCINEE